MGLKQEREVEDLNQVSQEGTTLQEKRQKLKTAQAAKLAEKK
ncbi:MAG: hypothetical protein ACNYNY_02030 [Candidatus Oxydemutatoraceae bacterium WSBS_2016_MAG_OTU14]